MKNSHTRRGVTQHINIGQVLPNNQIKCHSRMLLSGIFNACRLRKSLKTACVEDPRLQPSGMTSNFKEEALNKVYRLGGSPTGAASKLWDTCHKAGNLSGLHPTYKLTYKEEALNKGAFRAPLHFGFTLRPSSSRNVLMRDIGAAHTLYPALQACGVTERVAHGFTLIELLVVVLIIGILAAVALPQYQKAVMRSRYATLKNMTEALYQAEQVYFLAHGTYTGNFEVLDIQPNGCTMNKDKNRCYFPGGFCELSKVSHRVHCENTQTLKNGYVRYWDDEKKRFYGSNSCWALTTDITDKYHKLCEAEGGKNPKKVSCTSDGCHVYVLSQGK